MQKRYYINKGIDKEYMANLPNIFRKTVTGDIMWWGEPIEILQGVNAATHL